MVRGCWQALVLCDEADGLLKYPDPWPQCSSTVQCAHPTTLTIPPDIYTDWQAGNTVYYDNSVIWRCKDRRYKETHFNIHFKKIFQQTLQAWVYAGLCS